MPVYEYRCECGYEEDIHAASMAFGQVLLKHPPKCSRCGKPMERRPTMASVRFKGEGWTEKQSNPARDVEEKQTYPADKST